MQLALHWHLLKPDQAHRYLQRRRDRQGPHFTYEVIIVDDGSQDRTVGVAHNYVRQHGLDAIRVLRLPCNHGKARPTALPIWQCQSPCSSTAPVAWSKAADSQWQGQLATYGSVAWSVPKWGVRV